MSKNSSGKLQLAVICGGKSSEHEVSLVSAQNILRAVDQERYELHLLAITRQGAWRLYNDVFHFTDHSDNPDLISLREDDFESVLFEMQPDHAQLRVADGRILHFDVVFPIMHGSFAEDGKMQGLLEMFSWPYVGPDVLGSALAMDKAVTKNLVRQAGIKIADFIEVTQANRQEWSYEAAAARLGETIFVKPANAGSSVGISKTTNQAAYNQALAQAFRFDRKVLLEQAIVGRELECSVFGNADALQAGEVGEVVPSSKYGFYSYDAKYLDADGAALYVPAMLTASERELVRQTAVQVMAVCQCEGMARVDFFLSATGDLYLNEINTIPGFTNISMYPKLMMAETGWTYGELVDRLLQLAIARQQRNAALIISKK